jgi:hypothetical protein
VGVCLNRPPAGGCQAGPIDSVDLRGLKPAIAFHGEAADVLTPALVDLIDSGLAVGNAPGRCSAGLKRKNCSVASDCDRYLGSDDGICNFATGVDYDPSLEDGVNQTTPCTPGVGVVVPAGETLRLKMQVRRAAGFKGDKDNLRLICEP